MNIKITLKAARVNAGLTVKDVSKYCNISESTIKNWERGKSFPKPPAIEKLCKLYGVGYDDINFDVRK